MLAYNKNKLLTWMKRKMVVDAAAGGLISEDEKSTILTRYPSPFFNPGTIMRLGLGFSTMTALSMFFSLIMLVLDISFGNFITHMLYGAALIFLLEYMIRKRSHFRSGIDDVLLYMGYGTIMAGLITLFDNMKDPSIPLVSIATVLALFAALRYADRIMAGLALTAFIYLIGLLLIRINFQWWVALPLITAAIAAATWFLTSKLIHKPEYIYYRDCLGLIQTLSLAIAGVCTNYYIVSEWWFKSGHGEGIGGFWNVFFAVTTLLLPLVTVVTGFREKDKKRIRVGILLIAALIMTFHYYFTSTPSEILCIIYGSYLLLVGYWLLKHHKASENGISFSEKQDSSSLFQFESMLIGAGAGLVTPENSGLRFGGGSFGGSGSAGNY